MGIFMGMLVVPSFKGALEPPCAHPDPRKLGRIPWDPMEDPWLQGWDPRGSWSTPKPPFPLSGPHGWDRGVTAPTF